MNEPAIKIANVSKTFKIRDRSGDSLREKLSGIFLKGNLHTIEALKNINLEIQKGEFLGVIGHNGSGKSTLLKIMMKAFPPDKGGEVIINGKYMRLALGMGFNPGLSVRQNIYTNASILGITFREIGNRFEEILDFSELHNFVDTQVKYLSSGMRSRLMFAIALHAEADIFLMDEFFGGVGDVSFQKKCQDVFEKSFLEGRTIIHVSHRVDTIKKHCKRVLLLHKGEQICIGAPNDVIKEYHKLMKVKVPTS